MQVRKYGLNIPCSEGFNFSRFAGESRAGVLAPIGWLYGWFLFSVLLHILVPMSPDCFLEADVAMLSMFMLLQLLLGMTNYIH